MATAGEYVALLAPGDRLADDALLRVALALSAHPAARAVYADHDRLDAEGRRGRPSFKPDWNPEWFRTRDYIGSPCFVAADAAGAIDDGALRSDRARAWDWRAQALAAAGASAVVHIPRILCHCPSGDDARDDADGESRRVIESMLARTRVDAAVERSPQGWRIRYALASPPPRVSIVIPTRDRAALLERCVDSIVATTRYPDYEIVLVDNDSREPAALRLLAALAAGGRARVIRVPGPFNFATACNAGVAAAAGEVLVLLNNDTEIVAADWLATLVGHACEPGVAFVGALLLYPDRTIQHAGVIAGLNGVAGHRFRGRRLDDPAVAPWIAEASDVSIVSAACTAIRRDRYAELGGLDETLAVANNDVDACLRALARGFRNVFTPHAALIHRESASRGYENAPEARARLARETAIVRARWGALLRDDPAYNPNLALDGAAYGLAFPPRRRD